MWMAGLSGFNPLFIRGVLQQKTGKSLGILGHSFVSIPYSSGGFCNGTIDLRVQDGYIGNVSIPYSSGGFCNTDTILKTAAPSRGFQSLIHQGGFATSVTRMAGLAGHPVSIPYSSGGFCNASIRMRYTRSAGRKFQSLIHQGGFATSDGRSGYPIVCILFQSLIHQGGFATSPNPAYAEQCRECFNPLFIRGVLQHRRSGDTNLCSSTRFQSLIHQGGFATAPRPT